MDGWRTIQRGNALAQSTCEAWHRLTTPLFQLSSGGARRRTNRLALEYACAPDGQRVHIEEARRSISYRCPMAACGERLVVRGGHVNRKHFAHRRNSACINPATLHRWAIKWLLEEKGIALGRPDLIDESSFPEIFTGIAAAEVPLPVPTGTRVARVRRPDVLIRSHDCLVAVEFVRTHDLDAPKLRDYLAIASKLRNEGLSFGLLVVYLGAEFAWFTHWSEALWRNHVLFDAPRRWIAVTGRSVDLMPGSALSPSSLSTANPAKRDNESRPQRTVPVRQDQGAG